MKLSGLILLLVSLLVPMEARAGIDSAPKSEGVLSVMSYNILYDSPKWGPAHAWADRRPRMAKLLQRHAQDLIGFQEVREEQLRDLQAMLPDHAVVGNIPGLDSSEAIPWVMNPVFFRRDRVQVLETGFTWLTSVDDRGVPQAGWPEIGLITARPAHAVWARFHRLREDDVFYHVNLHLPPNSPSAREKAIERLLQLLANLAPDTPIIVAGDYNASAEPAFDLLASAGLVDARGISASKPVGPPETKVDRDTGRLGTGSIDHIFISRDVQVLAFATIDDRFDGRHPSDHLPVLASVAFAHR